MPLTNGATYQTAAHKEENGDPASGRLEGRYADHFRIGSNAFEFVIEFGQFYEGGEDARHHTRVAINPCYAKELLIHRSESIEDYELRYGEITGGRLIPDARDRRIDMHAFGRKNTMASGGHEFCRDENHWGEALT